MFKKRKKNNPEVGNVYLIPLADESWTLGQICHMKETEGYFSLTVAFFNIHYPTKEQLIQEIVHFEFNDPIFVFSVAGNPFRNNGWIFEKSHTFNYKNVNIEEHITGSWGWYNKCERDINWILEMYFGVYPWDGFGDPFYIDKLLLPNQKKPPFAKMKNMFSNDDLEKLNLL
ncbi:hypothetical protein [Flavobacterium sp.]|uniref:hypothetical protein n=1 Tax=Flavobacterium sp. TaxID=239 RepID=UPI0031DE4F8B